MKQDIESSTFSVPFYLACESNEENTFSFRSIHQQREEVVSH